MLHKFKKYIAIGVMNLVLFYFLIRWFSNNVNSSLLFIQLNRVPLETVVFSILINVLALVFYGNRLSHLVARPFSESFKIANLGLGFNALLPFRLGEVVRIYFARRYFSVSISKLFVAGLVEKFFDLTALGVFLVVLALFTSSNFISRGAGITVFSGIILMFTSAVLFEKYSHYVESRMSRVKHVKTLIISLRQHGKVHDIWQVVGYTFASWLANVLVVYIAFSGFLPMLGFGIKDAIALMLIIALSIAVPSAPAGLGIFEAGVFSYIKWKFHIGNEVALANAIILHMVMIIPQVFLAFLALVSIWTSKKDVR